MNRTRLLAVGIMFLFALTTSAQQVTSSTGGPTRSASSGEHAAVPTATGQLIFLTNKLALTGVQQEKIKPILQELHGTTMKLVQDQSLSREERLSRVRDSRFAADKKIRAILDDDQKTKLDQVEQEPHPELHGDLKGSNR